MTRGSSLLILEAFFKMVLVKGAQPWQDNWNNNPFGDAGGDRTCSES
ncbi:hypothetical protein H6G89_28630 [Oscillatoria sp. FACHB-1407]|nr:hypothetical protein [Oscillatoria sp. FACHB-1407]MBD2464975.1 hypothetical protein [Oscillatoria sp. FACHB-1407]